jgi:hypothetical protein
VRASLNAKIEPKEDFMDARNQVGRTPSNQGPQTPQTSKQGKGCLYYGCITAIIIAVVLCIGIFFGARYFMSEMVERYTQEKPQSLPALDSSTESYLRVKERVEQFQSAARAGQQSTLELTADEINTFLSSYPGLEGLTEYFRVAIPGDSLDFVLSVPLDQMGVENRYLNGTASLAVSIVDGKPQVGLRAMQIGGVKIPEEATKQFSEGNLFDQIEPRTKDNLLEILSGVHSVVVERGVLRLNGGSSAASKNG